MTFSDARQRDKWGLAMRLDMMSSEESEIQGDEEVLVVKPLSWRSDHVNEVMKRLDEKVLSEISAQAHRQAKMRDYSGQPSSRSRPILGDLPNWLFKE